VKCRHCHAELYQTFVDLGFAPPSNAYLDEAGLHQGELYYPLKTMVCRHCWLVQTEDCNQPEDFFNDSYAYFSSTSTSWLRHARDYCEMITNKLSLTEGSHVIELASNDGYLLKNFVEAQIPCLGIEPTESTAAVAEAAGIPVIRKFFGVALAKELISYGKEADLIIGNNVYAHVPDINDFTQAMQLALKPEGTITLEFPHLMNLVRYYQFDTIYHEHFSYLSLSVVSRIFSACGLRIYDVEEISTHGGSLRIYGCQQDASHPTTGNVSRVISEELGYGLESTEIYGAFQNAVDSIKNGLLAFLLEKKKEGYKVLAYGAAAKGNTLLNYAGIKPDLLPAVFDAAAFKQDKFLPGSHIPILHPDALKGMACDYLLILPWNIAEEIKSIIGPVVSPGARFIKAVPEITEI